MTSQSDQTPPIRFPGTAFDLVVLAASAGGLQAIDHVLSSLPADFPAAIAVVQHVSRQHRSYLASILNRHTSLQVKPAEAGEHLSPGTVYIAPPDHHLLVNRDSSFSLVQSELVHFVRPSADLLFESAAASYRTRALAVVLTGTGSDGNMGVTAIKKMGGLVIVQNQETSEFFGMPSAAIQTGSVDLVLPLNEISAALVTLVRQEARDDHDRRQS